MSKQTNAKNIKKKIRINSLPIFINQWGNSPQKIRGRLINSDIIPAMVHLSHSQDDIRFSIFPQRYAKIPISANCQFFDSITGAYNIDSRSHCCIYFVDIVSCIDASSVDVADCYVFNIFRD